MQLDLQTINIQPLRQTFDNLAARFGDKPATRYQEGTYDIQQTYLYHYRPTWDPDREIFDERRTAIRMKDWYDFKDPRQFYYGTYTIARARQQEAAEANFQFVLDQGLLDDLSDEVCKTIVRFLVPMRHVEWGANMNNTFISAYSYGTAINAATMFNAMDRLAIAQYISRIGLAIDGEAALDEAKAYWMDAPEWQPLRRYVEDTLVTQDWFELFVAQNLVLDATMYQFLYVHLEKHLSKAGGPAYALLCSFMKEWYAENVRWVDSVMKAAVADSESNKTQIRQWVAQYTAKAQEAVKTLANGVFADRAAEVMETISTDLATRLQKVGI